MHAFKHAIMIIELHPQLVENGDDRVKQLINQSSELFDMQLLKTGARDLSPFPILEKFSDDNRWLVCSEGRSMSMSWLVLSPKR